MKDYIALLKTHRNLSILTLAQMICYFGAWFSHMAIYTLLIELDAPVWAITATAAMTFLPGFLLSPFSGAIIDKVHTKRLMLLLLGIEITTVGFLLMIDSLDWLWFLLILVFIRMGTATIYFQTEMSLLPKLLPSAELKLANEIHSIVWSISYTAGMAIAGFYIHAFGTTSAFIADMILYSIGFFLIAKLDLPSLVHQTTETIFKMMKEGLLYLRQRPLVMHLMFLHACVGFTAYDALIALLADYQYTDILSIPLVIGLINASRALSLTVGPLFLSRYTNERSLFTLLFLQGIGIISWGALQFHFYLGFIGIVFAGFFTTTLWSFTYTLLQKNIDKNFYGRIVAYNDMIFCASSTLVSIMIGFLFDLTLPLFAITIILGLLFIGSAYYWKWIQKHYM